MDGVMVFFIGKTALIHNKESTGRAKDLGTPRSCAGDDQRLANQSDGARGFRIPGC